MLSLKASVLAAVFCVTFRRDFDLSLNGKDALVNGEVPITDIGIVPGDIIKLIVNDADTPDPGKSNFYTFLKGLHAGVACAQRILKLSALEITCSCSFLFGI